jgi:hypothetical protein
LNEVGVDIAVYHDLRWRVETETELLLKYLEALLGPEVVGELAHTRGTGVDVEKRDRGRNE